MPYFLVIIALVALDQVTKHLAFQWLQPVATVPLIDGVFHLTFAKNTGAAFSILRDRQLLLILLTSVVISLIIGLLLKQIKTGGGPWMALALSLIIGGAIGNLIDRMRLNYVIDFFDFRLINFAIFNVADIGIVCGTALLAFLVIFKDAQI